MLFYSVVLYLSGFLYGWHFDKILRNVFDTKTEFLPILTSVKLCVTNTVGDAYDECVNQFVAEETEGGPSLVTSLLFVRLDQSNLAVSRKVRPEVSNIDFVAENVLVESGSTENDMIFDEFYFIYSTENEEQPKTI